MAARNNSSHHSPSSKVNTNFGGLDKKYSGKDAKIVVIPVPYDKTSTWVKGADRGPEAILEASANMELYDIETDSEVYLQGIITDKAVLEDETPEKMVKSVEERVKKHLKNNKFIVLLGGEHSVSIGSFYAHAERFKNLTILQLDAHSDTREEYHGTKNNHACVMARARERCDIVQVGIRSLDSEEKINRENIFFAKDIYNNDGWMDKAIAKLKENVYLTIDLYSLYPSIMPSTGTPEPGGMLWYQTITFLRKVIQKRNVVGLDVVELCPNEEHKAPDFLTAKLIYTILSYKFSK